MPGTYTINVKDELTGATSSASFTVAPCVHHQKVNENPSPVRGEPDMTQESIAISCPR